VCGALAQATSGVREPRDGARGGRAGRTARTARRGARPRVPVSNDADYPCLTEYISKVLN
jgi:hypothetical protein